MCKITLQLSSVLYNLNTYFKSKHASKAQRLEKKSIPPDYYTGARDVQTPYGKMRVYEWGPEEGRKVMLVHGDATCAPLWKRVAEELVARGCRVCVIGMS